MSQYDRQTAQAALGLNVRYAIIPAQTGVPAVGVVVTAGAGAWGAYKDIAAAKAITTPFWICGLFFDTPGATQIYEGQLADATPTLLYPFRLEYLIVGAAGYSWHPSLSIGPPIWMAANAQVQARTGAAAAKVLGISMLYAVGL